MRWRRLRHPVLARPLGRTSNRQIDAALERAGLTRAALFTYGGAIARHRTQMAGMLEAHGVDVARAVVENWEDLKLADHYCAHCRNARRCSRWLQWGRRNDAPKMFCVNANLFASIAASQAVAASQNDNAHYAEHRP